MTQPALHRGATQGGKGSSAGRIAVLHRDSQAKSAYSLPLTPGTTLHPAQRSPCYVVQDRLGWAAQ
jgi:hypothetical protein